MSGGGTGLYYREKMKSILKDNASYRYVDGLKNGKLSHRRLYKAKFTDKVFCKKTRPSEKNYNIDILVDCSGSMRHIGKREHCADAMVLLCRQMQEVANIKITGFNEISKVFTERGHKNTEDELKVLREAIVQMTHDDGYGGNHDGYHLRQCVEDLKKVKGEKLIMVLSDGRPTCDEADCGNPGCFPKSGGGMGKDLKRAIDEVEMNKIPVMGIGICDSSVKEYYPRCEVIQQPDRILEVALKLLSSSIRRV